MANLYIVVERNEEEVQVVVVADEQRALSRVRDRRDSYVADSVASPQFTHDDPSHVYDSSAGWELWCEESLVL